MWSNPQRNSYLVTFREEILNEKLRFLHNVYKEHLKKIPEILLCKATVITQDSFSRDFPWILFNMVIHKFKQC